MVEILYKGYTICRSSGGGKAGKGHNKTASVQVRQSLGPDSYLLKKQFRFTVGNDGSFDRAFTKAVHYIDNELPFLCCPNCDSPAGFKVDYIIEGSGWEERSFRGVVSNADRYTSDRITGQIHCLNCDHPMEQDRLLTDFHN